MLSATEIQPSQDFSFGFDFLLRSYVHEDVLETPARGYWEHWTRGGCGHDTVARHHQEEFQK